MGPNPKKVSVTPKSFFTVQWHITSKCDLRCKHCYMFDSSFQNLIENELSLEKCFETIDDFHKATIFLNKRGRIYFTGGDPLIRQDCFDIIEYASKKNISVGILGSPQNLDLKTAKKLKKIGVFRYQLSIDGMEETHDEIREKGHFRKTLEAIKILRKVNIQPVIMFTLNSMNVNEIFNVIDLAVKEKVHTFNFARLVSIGSGKNFKELPSSQEYREILLKIYNHYKYHQRRGCDTILGLKDNLWILLFQELGILTQLFKMGVKIRGCPIGNSTLCILSDGTAYPCRRLPIKIDTVLSNNITDIIMKSHKLREMREYDRFEKCHECELLNYCRGCPAISYGLTGNCYGPDPQCWKEIT